MGYARISMRELPGILPGKLRVKRPQASNIIFMEDGNT
jgi:hypothetical protein